MVSFGTREEAEKYKDALDKQRGGWTTGEAVKAYLAKMRDEDCAESSIARAEHSFKAILGDLYTVPISEVTSRRLQSCYDKRRKKVAVDTHRGELATVKVLFRWVKKQKWIRGESPADDVDPVGKRSRGKPQPRISDARKLLAKALELGDEGDHAAIAVALTLLTAKRASEITKRLVRDVDDDGRLLVIRRAKTRASERSIKIPEMLRGRILRVAAGRGPDEPLWGYTKRGRPVDRQWLYYHVKRLVDAAGIEDTCPHGLRGAHSSVAIDEGIAIEQVARALGHTSTEVTRRHYIRGGAEDDARAAAFLTVLEGGKSTGAVETGAATPVTTTPAIESSPENRSDLSANGGTRTPTVLPTGT